MKATHNSGLRYFRDRNGTKQPLDGPATLAFTVESAKDALLYLNKVKIDCPGISHFYDNHVMEAILFPSTAKLLKLNSVIDYGEYKGLVIGHILYTPGRTSGYYSPDFRKAFAKNVYDAIMKNGWAMTVLASKCLATTLDMTPPETRDFIHRSRDIRMATRKPHTYEEIMQNG